MGDRQKPPAREIIKIGKKTWKRTYRRDPWNNPQSKLELFLSPTLELAIGPPKPRRKPWPPEPAP